MARSFRPVALAVGVGSLAALLVACQTLATGEALPPLALAPSVDLPRFMGDWYVIASIPTAFEKGAHDAVESYRLAGDGTVDIDFTYRSDAADGPRREMRSRGFVEAPANAVWGVQFIWPFKADYRITYVADDYSTTVVSREKRDHVWIMARRPQVAEAEYQRLVALVAAQGYDTGKLQRVPQSGR